MAETKADPAADLAALRAQIADTARQVVDATDGWKPFYTAPKDGTQILVWMPKPRFGSHVQPMRTGNVALIGGVFAFDCPTPLYWRPMLDPPTTPAERDGGVE